MADYVSELLTRILDNLGSSAFSEINWILGVKDELRRIKETLLVINAVLLDAREQQSASQSSKLWLQNLKLVAYDIEDVLDLIATQELELKVNGRSLLRKITRLFTNYDVAREVRAIRHRLDEVEYNRRSSDFQERQAPRPAETSVQRETYSYVRESDVIGRKKEKEGIISCLISSPSHDDHCLTVIPIIGIGGIGKTTLAKVVFNDPRVVSRFELRLWAHVSSKFDLKTLIATILRTATGMNFSHYDLELLQSKFRETICGKTYLLILDDVWTRDPKEWMELKELLVIGSPKSAIVLTTREERVASIFGTMEAHNLRSLSDDHCWSIFAKYAFKKGEQQAYPLLVEIGKSIVQKCHGVPLAAKTLGSVLRHDRDDRNWRKVEESEVWEIEQGPDDILPALKLSYDQTPYHLRSCFSFCATYGKGHFLVRSELVNRWMALGFLQSKKGDEEFEDIGNNYYHQLLSRSILQFPSDNLTENFIVEFGQVFRESSVWNDALHFIKSNMNDSFNLVSQSFLQPAEKIIVLEMHDLLYDLAAYVSEEHIGIGTSNKQTISPRAQYILWDQEDLSRKDFPMRLLEASRARMFAFVHHMGYVSLSFLKGLISTLKCLRVLGLPFAEFEELPDSIGDLKHLRYISLAFNLKLRVLPWSICKLVNLQTLELFSCIKLETLPKDFHKLINLRYLSLTAKMRSLPKGCLNGLRSLRVLRFWFCQNLTSLSEEIGSLDNLRSLGIYCCGSITTLPNEMKYLNKLEELLVHSCRSLVLKDWEGLYGLRSLRDLDFCELPKLLAFPNGIASCGDSLRYFRITRCEGLKTLPKGLQHCTSLLSLALSSCPNLTALPSGISALKSLQRLDIDGCPDISRGCEKDKGRGWHIISHIPEIHIDHEIIQNKAFPSYTG